MWNYYHMGGLGFGLGWIFQLIFWALVIWLILVLVNHFSKKSGNRCCGMGEDKEGEALQILKNRYAKGEIKKEEFEQMKKDLR